MEPRLFSRLASRTADPYRLPKFRRAYNRVDDFISDWLWTVYMAFWLAVLVTLALYAIQVIALRETIYLVCGFAAAWPLVFAMRWAQWEAEFLIWHSGLGNKPAPESIRKSLTVASLLVCLAAVNQYLGLVSLWILLLALLLISAVLLLARRRASFGKPARAPSSRLCSPGPDEYDSQPGDDGVDWNAY